MIADESLHDQLTDPDVADNLVGQPELIRPLKALLPPGLQLISNPTADHILPIVQAPQFVDAIQCLETALEESGLPPALMGELGLPVEAGKDVDAFLKALEGLRPDDDDSMDS